MPQPPQPTISNPAQGSSTAIPCTANGGAHPSSGYVIAGMAYQINTGPVIGFTQAGGTFAANGGPWSLPLRVSDCPNVGLLYLLTIYVGDSSGGTNTNSTNFTRSS